MKERIHTTLTPLFSDRLDMIVTSDVTASARARDVKEPEGCEAMTIIYRGRVQIIVPFKATPGLIAHEIYHATLEILKRCGVKSGQNNQEPVAYMLGWLTDWAVKKI